MGKKRTRQGATLAAIVAAAVQAHAAASPKPEWKVVPGHKNIMVDMASVAPMSRGLEGPRLPGQYFGETTDPERTERTSATIKLNGHIFTSYMMVCSGFGADSSQETTVDFPTTKLNDPERIMGYVPARVVEDLACPIARGRHPLHHPKSN